MHTRGEPRRFEQGMRGPIRQVFFVGADRRPHHLDRNAPPRTVKQDLIAKVHRTVERLELVVSGLLLREDPQEEINLGRRGHPHGHNFIHRSFLRFRGRTRSRRHRVNP